MFQQKFAKVSKAHLAHKRSEYLVPPPLRTLLPTSARNVYSYQAPSVPVDFLQSIQNFTPCRHITRLEAITARIFSSKNILFTAKRGSSKASREEQCAYSDHLLALLTTPRRFFRGSAKQSRKPHMPVLVCIRAGLKATASGG